MTAIARSARCTGGPWSVHHTCLALRVLTASTRYRAGWPSRDGWLRVPPRSTRGALSETAPGLPRRCAGGTGAPARRGGPEAPARRPPTAFRPAAIGTPARRRRRGDPRRRGVCFEPFDHPDRGLGLRVTRRAEPGEEALLLVRGVPQKDRPKVVQSCGERFAIGFRERSSPPTVGDGHKPREQPFDPPGPSLNGPNGASTP